jgi:hypothetical protein
MGSASDETPGRSESRQLAVAALDLLEETAFNALRGPMGRGAVPAQALAQRVNLSRSTIERRVREQFDPDSTAFDLVVSYLSNDSVRGGEWSPNRFIDPAEQMHTQGEPIDTIVQKIFADRFTHSKLEAGFLASYLIQCAACASALHSNSTDAVNSAIEGRRQHFDRMGHVFEVTMIVALHRLGRRPRQGRTTRDIVVILNGCYDGMLLRSFLQPDAMAAETAAEVIWSLALSMTEPGLFSPPNKDSSPVELQIVENVINSLSRERSAMSLDLGTSEAISVEVVREIFPTLESLVDRCLDLLIGSSDELRQAISALDGDSLVLVENLLESLATRRNEYPELIESVDHDGPFISEAAAMITEALQRSEQTIGNVERQTELNRLARFLLDQALDGDSGWRRALEVLFLPKPKES